MTRCLTALSAGFAAALMGTAASAATVTIAGASVGKERELLKQAAAEWEKQTGHTVEIASVPDSTSEQVALYQQLLAAESADIDVFPMDVIFVGTLGPHMIDLSKHVDQSRIDKHFDHIVQNNTVKGRFVGMPWYTDAPFLYYRKDLLKKYNADVPTTWSELQATARKIQTGERKDNKDFRGYLFQGRAYEGLTCVGLEMVKSHGGGEIVNPETGKITIKNDDAAAGIKRLASFIGDISPKATLNYNEPDTDGVFRNGNAAFMRNWTYVWGMVSDPEAKMHGKVGIAKLPKEDSEDGKHAHTLGGWQLAVSKYSKAPEAAVDFVKYLTRQEEQERRAVEAGLAPTIPALYEDKQVLKANPHFEDLFGVFDNAVARPSSVTGSRYNRVSNEFYNAVHSVLAGNMSAKASLRNLHRTLRRISRGGRW